MVMEKDLSWGLVMGLKSVQKKDYLTGKLPEVKRAGKMVGLLEWKLDDPVVV